MKKDIISLVIPVFNEGENIDELYEGIKAVKGQIMNPLEIIFIDDGSSDNSKEKVENIARTDRNVKLISFSRNYGQTTAIAAGIKHSAGEIIVTMDADLQNDPADIPKLVRLIDEGFDVVSGWRKKRKDAIITRKIPSQIANTLIAFFTGVKLHDFGCTLKAYRKQYIGHLSIHGEMHRFMPAYCVWQGATITEIAVNHRPRVHGQSKYGISRTLKVILDLMVIKFLLSYLTKPIYVFGGIALSSFVLGLFINIFVIYRKFYISGEWFSPLFIIGALMWVFSMLCLLLGLLAEVVVRMYFEITNKPLYNIKDKVNF